MSKSGVGGVLLQEAKYINLSLHYLEQVSDNGQCQVPVGPGITDMIDFFRLNIK